MDLSSGSFRLFRALGIDVFLHWSWFLVAYLQISMRRDEYRAPSMKVAEYVTLFFIVMLHEFGHALACRSVGGKADRIVLWPLGGVAYVAPPARPGAYLWSIVAGPLVNFLLVGPLFGLYALATSAGWAETHPDLHLYLWYMALLNLLLLLLNLLPIFPLDGGQILMALLWYGLGRWRSLQVVSLIGLTIGFFSFLFCILMGWWLMSIIPAFIAMNSFASFQRSRLALYLLNLPRHADCACPKCGVEPPRGPFWVCDECQTRFDLFETHGQCPACGAWYHSPSCPHCHQDEAHIQRWFSPSPVEAEVSSGDRSGE